MSILHLFLVCPRFLSLCANVEADPRPRKKTASANMFRRAFIDLEEIASCGYSKCKSEMVTGAIRATQDCIFPLRNGSHE